MHIDNCLAQVSSKKLLPAVEVNEYRDPQPDNVQKVRDLITYMPKRDISTK